MRRNNFRKLWRRAVDGDERGPGAFTGTDLEGLVFHELRHTAAALAIAQGAHPMVVKERLGHSSITVTMDRYGHLFPSQDQALAEALDQPLRESLLASTRPGAPDVAQNAQVSAVRVQAFQAGDGGSIPPPAFHG